jgi:hypothetical protein
VSTCWRAIRIARSRAAAAACRVASARAKQDGKHRRGEPTYPNKGFPFRTFDNIMATARIPRIHSHNGATRPNGSGKTEDVRAVVATLILKMVGVEAFTLLAIPNVNIVMAGFAQRD